jgi:hypothetical protein
MHAALLSKRSVLVAAVLAAAIGSTPSANAMESSIGDALGGTTTTITFGHTVSQSIRVTPVPSSLNGYSVSAVCTAAASPDASSTAVEVCSVDGVGLASRVSLPGPASAATTLATAFKGTWVSACVQASADFVESLVGPGSITNPMRCFPVFLP